MTNDVTIACECGTFQAAIHGASPENGNHAICYCVDCQAFPRHLGQTDRILDEAGGTDLYQTQPHRVHIRAGADKLAVLRLGPKGLYRWHTTCCNTPICTTMGSPKFSFAGFLTANVTSGLESLGPVQFRYKPDHALKPVTEPSGSLAKFAFRTMRSALACRINGKWKETPFFDVQTSKAVSKPYTLTEAEREAAYLVSAAT